MDNNSITDSVTCGISSEKKSATRIIVNTHCIVCGTAFEAARVGKLYCSTRCKQFGYNHKEQIKEVLSAKQGGIKPESRVFVIEDYQDFIKIQKLIKRQTHLKQKQTRWENAEHEVNMSHQYKTDASSYSWSTFVTGSLTQNEEDELYTAESEVPESLWGLKPRELSIEQWSFIKSLYPDLNVTSFIETVIGLSSDFIDELTLKASEKISPQSIIRNKFVNHCNMIAIGKVKFENIQQSI